MSAREFPMPDESGLLVGSTSQIAAERAHSVVLRNSRLLCWGTMGIGICSLIIGLCMVLMVFSVLTPLDAISFMRVLAALQWGLGGLMMGYMCPALWKWGQTMANYTVKMDDRGVDFNLGTKKKPVELFMAWDNVASVEQKRVGNAQQFTITGKDGSFARFSSYTFVRPKKIARMIAERVGQTIQRT
jgi:hypothetical protein